MVVMKKNVALVFIAISLVGTGLYVYSLKVVFPKPENCSICHFMAPYYAKWKTSTHNKVACLKCHDYDMTTALAAQFKFLARGAGSRPFSNVPDKNCLQAGCHDRRLLESKVTTSKMNISFDHFEHKPHFTQMELGIQLLCRSCHSDILQGEHMKVSMKVCYLCHFKGVPHDQAFTGCPSCHTSPDKPITVAGKSFSHNKAVKAGLKCQQCHLAITRGEGITPKEKCFFCHVDRSEQYSNVQLIHAKHVTDKQIDCLWCHEVIEHGKIRMPEKIPNL